MTEIMHNKHLPEVFSYAKCTKCNSNDKEAIAYVGDNYNFRYKHRWLASKYGKRRQSIAYVMEHVTFRQPSDCPLE